MTTGDLKMEVDSAVATEKRKHEEEMREMERKLKMLEREGAASKENNRRLTEKLRVDANVHQKKERRLANLTAAAEAKRDQALEQTLTAEKQTAAAEKRKRIEVAQATSAQTKAIRETHVMEMEKNQMECKKNAAQQSELKQKEKFKEERRRQLKIQEEMQVITEKVATSMKAMASEVQELEHSVAELMEEDKKAEAEVVQ